MVVPEHVAEHHRRSLEPRDPPHRGRVGDDVEVAVALLPARDGVPVHRVHLHVEGEQVVAAFDRVTGLLLLDEELRVEPLPHQAPLHVRERDDHRVDVAGGDGRLEFLEAQHATILRGSSETIEGWAEAHPSNAIAVRLATGLRSD